MQNNKRVLAEQTANSILSGEFHLFTDEELFSMMEHLGYRWSERSHNWIDVEQFAPPRKHGEYGESAFQ